MDRYNGSVADDAKRILGADAAAGLRAPTEATGVQAAETASLVGRPAPLARRVGHAFGRMGGVNNRLNDACVMVGGGLLLRI